MSDFTTFTLLSSFLCSQPSSARPSSRVEKGGGAGNESYLFSFGLECFVMRLCVCLSLRADYSVGAFGVTPVTHVASRSSSTVTSIHRQPGHYDVPLVAADHIKVASDRHSHTVFTSSNSASSVTECQTLPPPLLPSYVLL